MATPRPDLAALPVAQRATSHRWSRRSSTTWLGELLNQLDVLREDVRLMEDAAAAEIARAKVPTLPCYERLP